MAASINSSGIRRRVAVALALAALAFTAAACRPVTLSTVGRTSLEVGSVVPVPQHGTRIYCVVSHVSHDDPILFPGQPDAAHLHLFWGNSQTHHSSTPASMLTSGASSCEGGLNNRSGYWVPALFNEADEMVLPETIFVYYKSFGVADRTTIQPIPNGLEMVTDRRVTGSRSSHFRVESVTVDGRQMLRLAVRFPTCLAVGVGGEPVLRSGNGVDHVAFGGGSAPNGCPGSHPYRIPGLEYIVTYDVGPASGWYLSSDHDGDTPGASLHGDYIAAWDGATMDELTRCNREHRNCEFAGSRGQLPDRFLAPDGSTPLYASSVELLAGTDRTPFGTDLKPMAG